MEKLGHGGYVEELRVDRYKRAGCGADRTERQETELRRAIDDHDVVVRVDFRDRFGDAGEEEVSALSSLGEDLWSVVLELVQFQIPGNEIEASEVGWADDLGERPALVVVPDRAIQSLVLLDVELRLIAKERGHACLRIEIYR